MYLSVFNWPKYRQLFGYWTNKQSYFSKIAGYRNKLKTLETENGMKISVNATAPDSITSVIQLELKGKVEGTAISSTQKKMQSGVLD